jgi:hypothetical protein
VTSPFAAGDTPTAEQWGLYLPRIKITSTDQTVVSDATPNADATLVHALVASAVYVWEFRGVCDAGAGGFQSDFTIPTGASGSVSGIGDTNTFQSADVTTALAWYAGAVSDARVDMWGRLATAANAGNFQFLWSQNSSNAATTTLRANTYFRITRIS